ncbi:MAG: hypothetical protein NT169_22050 [Chloroflexi bacterium]|nr:hypothetical protein [Chloroflexota bacterium]
MRQSSRRPPGSRAGPSASAITAAATPLTASSAAAVHRTWRGQRRIHPRQTAQAALAAPRASQAPREPVSSRPSAARPTSGPAILRPRTAATCKGIKAAISPPATLGCSRCPGRSGCQAASQAMIGSSHGSLPIQRDQSVVNRK